MQITIDISKATTKRLLILAVTVFVGLAAAVVYAVVPVTFADGNVLTAAQLNQNFANLETQVVPSGAVMFFNLATCPAGWSDATAAQGRYLVGMPASGTLAGTSGTALSNEENRAVGQHTHSVSDPGHGHGVTDPGHAHGTAVDTAYMLWNSSTANGQALNLANSTDGTAIDAVNGTSTATTGVSVNENVTGIGISTAGTVAGTNAPYIQFLVCPKG